MHNPNARATQNYNIVEDLAQAPCAMSVLEVLQSCPTQQSTLLSVLGVQDLSNSNTISFSTQGKPRLPPYVPIHIHVAYKGINIRRMVVDEGASTCVMSLSCWKGLGSLEIVPSQSMLKTFDGHVFKPHDIVPAFPITLGGKTVTVEVEVVDTPIDYNLLLVRSLTYAIEVVPSSYFRCIKFTHEGKLVTIDQLSFYNAPNESGTAVLLVDNSTLACKNMGVGLYSYLMGSFNISAPILSVKLFPIYTLTQVARDQGFLERSFKTTYLSDPWTLPKSNTFVDKDGTTGMASPLFAIEVAYQTEQEKTAGKCSSNLGKEERNIYPLPVLSISSSNGSDPLDTKLFTYKTIMEVMCPIEKPWEISNHRSLFIPTMD